jgi:hypothetical protein
MNETASIFARIAIENLLHVHALTNMWRASDNDYYRKGALDWIEHIENHVASIRRELERNNG